MAQNQTATETLENPKGLTVAELLRINLKGLSAKPWILKADKALARKRAKALLNFRPTRIATMPLWSEHVMLSDKGFVGSIPVRDGRAIQIEGEGAYGCISDNFGKVWFVRTAPIDQGKKNDK